MAQAQGRGLPTPASTDNDDSDDDTEATDSAGTQPSFPGFGGGGLGLFGRGGATFGTIDSIGDGVLIINTPQGPVEAAVGSETVIQVFATGSLGDLTEGMSVTVMGQQDAESGKLKAASIIASPDGAFPGFGSFQNRPQGGGRRP